MSGAKIIEGLKDAVAGNFARVTIDGCVWCRLDRLSVNMQWERADQAKVDPEAYYVVQHNGHEWRDFDLGVLPGRLVIARLDPDYIRGRPEWIAKIVRPPLTSGQTK